MKTSESEGTGRLYMSDRLRETLQKLARDGRRHGDSLAIGQAETALGQSTGTSVPKNKRNKPTVKLS